MSIKGKKETRPRAYYGRITCARAWRYLRNYERRGDPMPCKGGMAQELGCSVRAINNWADKYPAFRRVFDQMKAEQERLLLNNGLNGTWNSQICRQMLCSNFGYYSSKKWVDFRDPDNAAILDALHRKRCRTVEDAIRHTEQPPDHEEAAA